MFDVGQRASSDGIRAGSVAGDYRHTNRRVSNVDVAELLNYSPNMLGTSDGHQRASGFTALTRLLCLYHRSVDTAILRLGCTIHLHVATLHTLNLIEPIPRHSYLEMSECKFITAASSGFGKYIALEALFRGHKVIASARNTSRIADLKEAGAETLTWTPKEDYDTFNTNVFDMLKVSKAFLPYIRSTPGHRTIANFGYIAS
ncbi:uncharacterized protein K460DRAFT_402939 [Cucurbitaria berberidis CBS 394.84]|uniref:NAD(P)-binding protein n=1 Tax=Cucurbitaria berberidis CBS 394.84 TaxID=1168544 RepID=A0A9P4GLU7_9PLEO|nr:uncharacterized protein K460DRAFT_402939 [Cucurbitaria berberidis CBS 394.84]KAF1847602.1 hypothetical protein K460DRAFT_402939 [Cucurbitaria berberidis CBS 394.84]